MRRAACFCLALLVAAVPADAQAQAPVDSAVIAAQWSEEIWRVCGISALNYQQVAELAPVLPGAYSRVTDGEHLAAFQAAGLFVFGDGDGFEILERMVWVRMAQGGVGLMEFISQCHEGSTSYVAGFSLVGIDPEILRVNLVSRFGPRDTLPVSPVGDGPEVFSYGRYSPLEPNSRAILQVTRGPVELVFCFLR